MQIKRLPKEKRQRVEAVVLLAAQSASSTAAVRHFLDVAHPELDGQKPLEAAAASREGLQLVVNLLSKIDNGPSR